MKWLGVAFALSLLYVATAPRQAPDGSAAALATGARALSYGRLDVGVDGDAVFTQTFHGRRLVTLPIGAQLVLVPSALIERHLPSLSVDRQGEVLAALCVIAVCLLFGRRLEREGFLPSSAAGVALLLGVMLIGSARVFDGSALATLFLYLALSATFRARAIVAGLAFAALMLVDPGYVAAALASAMWLAWRRRSMTAAALMGIPTLAGLALVLWHRRITGAWVDSGGLIEGVVGLLWSTGKGLLVFYPVLWALPWALWQPTVRRDLRAPIAIVAVAVTGVVAVGARWHADPSFGPARLLPLLPWLLFLVAVWARSLPRTRWVLAGGVILVAGTLFVQTLGVVVRASDWDQLAKKVTAQTGAPDWFADPASQVHFVPQFSPLVGHAWIVRRWLSSQPSVPTGDPWHLILPAAPRFDADVAKLQPDLIAMRGWLRALLLAVAMLAAAATVVRRGAKVPHG